MAQLISTLLNSVILQNEVATFQLLAEDDPVFILAHRLCPGIFGGKASSPRLKSRTGLILTINQELSTIIQGLGMYKCRFSTHIEHINLLPPPLPKTKSSHSRQDNYI